MDSHLSKNFPRIIFSSFFISPFPFLFYYYYHLFFQFHPKSFLFSSFFCLHKEQILITILCIEKLLLLRINSFTVVGVGRFVSL